MRLFNRRFERLHEHICSLPVLLPAEPLPPPTRSAAWPGAMVIGLLANRNIRIRPNIAQLLQHVGDGPYVSRFDDRPCVVQGLGADPEVRHCVRDCAGYADR